MKRQINWYAVYTKPRWEKRVAEVLAKKGVENYCPLNRVMKQWSDRKKTIMEPLFSSYVFVYATHEEHLIIKQTTGIINLVYWQGSPAVIRAEEIEAIKRFLGEYTDVKLEKIDVKVSDRVRITSGLLMHREGDVVEVKNKTVKVLLPSLGYAMSAEVAKDKIEVLNPSNVKYVADTYYGTKTG